MRTIIFIIQKEFRQIFRNKGMLPLIFILPVIQLVILANAATFEVNNIKFSFVDHDKSAYSRELLEKFESSDYFDVIAEFSSTEEANIAMQDGKVDVIFEIPVNFERDLRKYKKTKILVAINAIDGAAAGIENVYINQIVMGFNQNAVADLIHPSEYKNIPISVEAIPSFWFNETLNYKTFMVPGILVLLVTMITLFLSGMNIVREKEIGT